MAEPSALLHPSKLQAPKLAAKGQQYSTRFLYKLAIFVAFMAVLPLLPSEAPEFMNQSILNRSWELLHLLLVGIAISYGLFSHRNTDFDEGKETTRWKDEESPRAYVSHILHGSETVFDDGDDDEVEIPGEQSASSGADKIQTWSSQYRRNEPVVIVANGSNGSGDATSKPLFLPVRSLKSCSDDTPALEKADAQPVPSNGTVEGYLHAVDDPKRTLVLPSPIPWGSRSAKMDAKDESSAGTGMDSQPVQPLFPLVSSSMTRAAPTATSSTNRPSLSPEMRAKSSEDLLTKKKSLHKSSPPPAPPPPPPPFAIHSHQYSSERKAVTRSFTDELKDLSRRAARSGSEQQLFGYRSGDPGPLTGIRGAAERRNELMDDVANSSDDDSDREGDDDDAGVVGSPVEQIDTSNNNIAAETGAEGNEVDKKADEFIAKFREQIRLQRIECIKRSTAQRTVKRSNTNGN